MCGTIKLNFIFTSSLLFYLFYACNLSLLVHVSQEPTSCPGSHKQTRGFYYQLHSFYRGSRNRNQLICWRITSTAHDIGTTMAKTILCVTLIAIFIVVANCDEPEQESDETRAVRAAVKVSIKAIKWFFLTTILIFNISPAPSELQGNKIQEHVQILQKSCSHVVSFSKIDFFMDIYYWIWILMYNPVKM